MQIKNIDEYLFNIDVSAKANLSKEKFKNYMVCREKLINYYFARIDKDLANFIEENISDE